MNWNVRQDTREAYLEVCKQAATNPKIFEIFKRLPAYQEILEHCNINIANSYLQKIKKSNRWLLDVGAIFDNDLYGGAITYNFGDVKCSPSTMQYVGVLSNLIDQLETLDNFRIVEIGGGYGGQCKVITTAFFVKEYHIIDLPEVNLLQDKYLNKAGVCNFETFSYPYPYQEYDLVVSNYSLSEIKEPMQSQYVRDILLRSRHGYITCNGPIHSMELLKGITISPDIENERKENFIIQW